MNNACKSWSPGSDAGRLAAASADAVCFGSLGQRSERSRVAIQSLVASTPPNALRVFDVNLRQNFFSSRLINESLAFANVLTALLAAWLIFHVPFRGSVTLLLAESVIYSMVSLALGVLVASLTESQRVAMLFALLVTMLPSSLLSGMVFPIASMPALLQWVSMIVPARWFIIIARGIMLKGVGLTHLWRETLVLVAMTLVLMTLAVRSFKPRVA